MPPDGWPLVSIVQAQPAAPADAARLRFIDANASQSIALLEKLVNLNSGTYHPAGVQAVAALIEAELRGLGFETRLIPG